MLVPVILAGGFGTRLWPLSREAHPKQFISLVDGQSLFQQTLNRLQYFPAVEKPIVVGNEQHRFLMAEQVRQSQQPHCSLILEPSFRGTAPAVALAAIQALAQYDKDVLLLVLPADHMIYEPSLFAKNVIAAMTLAHQGKLVTFGVRPTRSETGYGYIQKGEKLANDNAYRVARFVEKPSLAKALQYIESQDYWWNSGIFLFSASTYLQELMLHEPEIFESMKKAFSHAQVDLDFIRPTLSDFEASPTNSIDYAVMEKTMNAVTIELASRWSDVGAWDAMAALYPADEKGNQCVGDVCVQQSQNCFIHADRFVVALGVKDLVVVETADAVLVLDKSHAQEIRQVVKSMKENDRKEVKFHRRVNRPWGVFESIDAGERFQVKRITVSVGEKLSLQRHHHRSEHWVVVKGTARVTRGEEVFLLSENQSTYIPIGVDHRLENVGKIPLEMIEVQSGAYLGEDDILRLEDQYGRLVENPEMTHEKRESQEA